MVKVRFLENAVLVDGKVLVFGNFHIGYDVLVRWKDYLELRII